MMIRGIIIPLKPLASLRKCHDEFAFIEQHVWAGCRFRPCTTDSRYYLPIAPNRISLGAVQALSSLTITRHARLTPLPGGASR